MRYSLSPRAEINKELVTAENPPDTLLDFSPCGSRVLQKEGSTDIRPTHEGIQSLAFSLINSRAADKANAFHVCIKREESHAV